MNYAVAIVRSALFWIAFALSSTVCSIGGVLAMPISRKGTILCVRGWALFHRWCCQNLLGQRIIVDGVMPDGPFLYVFKHESAFETIEQPMLFRHPAVFAKAELLDVPVWGRTARYYGLVPVNREGGSIAMRAMLAAARAALDAGRPLVLFAEGTRVAPGEAPPLRAGFAGIYRMLGVPVIPVAVNSGRVNPARKWVKWPGTITYRVGETIPPGLPRDAAEARVRAAINALNPPEALLAE